MKQWISDKKNLPIIIAVVVLLLIGAGVGIGFGTGLLGGNSNTAPVADVPASPGAPVNPGGAPLGAPPARPMPGQPAAAVPSAASNPFNAPVALSRPGLSGAPGSAVPSSPAAAIAASNLAPAQKAALLHNLSQLTPQQQAEVQKLQNMSPQQKVAFERKMITALASSGLKIPGMAAIAGFPGLPSARTVAISKNPFAPAVNIKQLTAAAVQPAVSSYVPFISITHLPNLGRLLPLPVPIGSSGQLADITAPLGRVAGIINSNGIRAIYEIDGKDTLVTPGSLLPEDGGRVVSIQSDGITVRLPGGRQTVQVPVSAGNPASSGSPQFPGAPPGDLSQPPDQTNNGDVTSD